MQAGRKTERQRDSQAGRNADLKAGAGSLRDRQKGRQAGR